MEQKRETQTVFTIYLSLAIPIYHNLWFGWQKLRGGEFSDILYLTQPTWKPTWRNFLVDMGLGSIANASVEAYGRSE